MNGNRWIQVNPVVFQGRGFAPKEDHVFVIMPFMPRWSSTVWATVRMTGNDLGLNVIRADELYGHQVLEDIWRGLCEASVVIADVTGRNPNVYYELGLAHVLGRRVLLLTQDVGDIPFDTRIYRHIRYTMPFWPSARKRAMSELASELKKTIKWIEENETLPLGGAVATAYASLAKRKPG